MNYYNPYLFTIPTSIPSRVGLLSRLFGGRNITFGSILSGTQKTLGVVNQAIPLVKQVHPMVKNAKTMFKVISEFKKNDHNINYTNTYQSKENNNKSQNNITQGPTFFL